MLETKFIRENLDLVKKSAKEKGYKIDVGEVVTLDDRRKKELAEVEELRRKRNELASQMKGGKPSAELVAEGKRVKEKLAGQEKQLAEVEEKLNGVLKQIPNVIFDDVPLGGEECSVEVKKWGEHHATGVDHLDYAVQRD